MELQGKGESPKRRVLFVSLETTLSGACIQLAHVMGRLPTHGWEPAVVAPEDGPVTEKFRACGVEPVFESQLLTDPSAVLRALVPRFDLVVANTIAAYPAVQAAHLENVPVVWYLHETLAGLRLINEIELLRPTLNLADAIVTPTKATAEIYRSFTKQPIKIVSYGIPSAQAHSTVAGRPFTFVTVGTYETRKGQDVFMEAIRELHPDVRWRALFQMAGETLEKSFRAELVAKAESMPNVQLFGPLSHEHALDLLNGADVLVCPSRDETMPTVLLEAMSLGKAIICTEVGGVREWLRDAANALLVPAEDPRALAIAIARCIGDRDLVRTLGAAAKQTFAEHFQLEPFVERFAAVLEETIIHARTKGTPDSYAEWVELYETLGPADRAALRRQLDSLGKLPLISILLPVFNPDLELLGTAIDSVKQQIYDQWELCIADDASTDPRLRPFLKKVAASDPRIKFTLRERNGHTAACSNSALALATGEWCALLDQDDMLAEHALANVALEIARSPEAGLIYSDEDRIDLTGKRSNPFFKMDWNPELFLGQNYINHLGVYRTELLQKMGGFREGFEGSQDYDLTFRCIEKLEADQIRHIPRVLYHWRMVSGSLAEKRAAKLYAEDAARRAITDHLRRVGIAARTEPCPENIESHRVLYELPSPVPRVLIIIDRNEGGGYVEKCINSISRLTNYPAYEVLAAADEQLNYLAMNASADILLFIHADIEVIDGDWLREMASHASREMVGAVGARLWYPDNTLQHAGFVLGLGAVADAPHQTTPRGHGGYFNRTYLQRNCSAVTAACMATRANVFRDLGGFDTTNLTSNFRDVDFCLRAKEHSLQTVWTPYANLVHHEATNVGRNESETERYKNDTVYMQERWGEELHDDPFYSPNLSLAPPGFALAFPPRWFSAQA